MTFLVTRPQPEADKTTQLMQQEGLDAVAIPLMHSNYLELDLDKELEDLEHIVGVIFTSKNAVRALKKSGNLTSLQHLAVYTVGDATAQMVRSEGFEQVYSAKGNVRDLICLLLQTTELRDKKLFYFTGEKHKSDLTAIFGQRSIDVVTRIVYSVTLNDQFSNEFNALLSKCQLQGVLLFSSEQAKAMKNFMIDFGKLDLVGKIPFYCLSSSIAEEVRGLSKKTIIAEQPTLKSLIKAIKSSCDRQE